MSSLNSTAVGLITKYVWISIDINTMPTIIIVALANFFKLKKLILNEVILLILEVMDAYVLGRGGVQLTWILFLGHTKHFVLGF
mgnify:CR=1 FL=1